MKSLKFDLEGRPLVGSNTAEKRAEQAFRKRLGVAVKQARLEVRMTQRDLALKARVGYRTLENVEAGRNTPSAYVLWKLAEALGGFAVDGLEIVGEVRR